MGAAGEGGGNDGDHRRVAGAGAPRPGSVRSVDGPAGFFAGHPMAYGLALAGAGGTALYALTVAISPGERRRRRLFAALSVQCTAQFLGIVLATERARHRLRQATS
jgi:hypothetical protein